MRVPRVGIQVIDKNRDRFWGMAWCVQDLEADPAERNFGSIAEWLELILGYGPGAKIDASAFPIP